MVEEKDAGKVAPLTTGEAPPETQAAAPATGPEASEAAPDYPALIASAKVELEAERKAKQTIEEKLRSTQANLHQRFDLQAELAAQRRASNRNAALLQLLVEAQQDGGEELPKRLAALKQTQQEEESQDTAQQEAMELRQDVIDEVETAGLDWTTAPDLKEARETWQMGVDQRDIRLLRRARVMVTAVRREAQGKALEKARQEAREAGRKEAEAEAKKKLTAAGVFDTPASRQASAPGGQGDAEFLKDYAERPDRHNTPADYKRAEQILARL